MTESDGQARFDPICGMWLQPAEVVATCTYLGTTYVFCSAACHTLFMRTPECHVIRLAHDPEEALDFCCPRQTPTLPSNPLSTGSGAEERTGGSGAEARDGYRRGARQELSGD